MSPYPSVDAKLAEFDANVTRIRQTFSQMPVNFKDKHWVSLKLTHMRFVDQYMRDQIKLPKKEQWNTLETQYFWDQFFPRWGEVDGRNTNDLKALLKFYSWFKVSEFGDEVDRNAWLIVQHADHDVNFQKTILPVLEQLYPGGETEPKNYGYLYDRIARNESRPQRYGTQGVCTEKGWVPEPEIENFDRIDERRRSLGMNTFAENKARLDLVCGK